MKLQRVICVVFLLLFPRIVAGEVMLEKVEYMQQPNCYRISNETVEVIVTTDIGPRIIRYSFIDGENILGERPEGGLETEWGLWKPWGGHRLWTAPEAKPRSYYPDNDPIEFELMEANSIRLVPPLEQETGIQKEMLVHLDSESTKVTIEHKITNKGVWPVKLAPWALTIMNGGGTAIISQEPQGNGLLPVRPLVLWPYTNMSDVRWTFGKKFILARTGEQYRFPQKIGAGNRQGWAAYRRGPQLFVKAFPYIEGAEYPDYGCNCEVYTNDTFVEVESLGPLAVLEPGQSVSHEETWYLFAVEEGFDESQEAIEAELGPFLEKISGKTE